MNKLTIALNPEQADAPSQKRTYTVPEIQAILGISRPTAYSLIKKNFFAVSVLEARSGFPKTASTNGWIMGMGVRLMTNPHFQKGKTSISVTELRRILGLSKVEAYWLVNQNRFRTIIAAGRMRVMLDSFEEWYASQFHYQKVNGEPPGSRWEATTMSIRQTAQLLGIHEATLYDLLKKKPFQTIQVNNRTRIDCASFWSWYESQDVYRTEADRQADRERLGETLTIPEIARLLGSARIKIVQNKQDHFE